MVCVGGEKSPPIIPKSSVPQGSILSPLLFALFINDLPPLIESNILLFADDLKIFSKIETIQDTRKLQRDIITINNWCQLNNLQLNIQKCHVMSFTRRHQSTFQYFNYNINNVTLNRNTETRDLGILFDSKLSFDNHISNMVSKAYQTLGFICRSLNKFKRIETYKLLYFTYVRSCLEYCTPIWNPHYSTHTNAIERVQRRLTRSLFRKFQFPAEKHFCMRNLRLEILSLEERRIFGDEIILYKIHTKRINTEIANSLHFNRPQRPTRHNGNNTFYLPFLTTNFEYFAPIHRLQRKHDELFSNVNINEPCLNAFKRYVLYEIQSSKLNFDYSFER